MVVFSQTSCSEYYRYHQDRAKNYQFSLVPIGAYLPSGVPIINGNCAIGDNGEYNDGPCDHKPTTNSPYPNAYRRYPFCKGFICYSCHSSFAWPYKTWYHKSEQMYPKPGTSGGPVGPPTINPLSAVGSVKQGITEDEATWRESLITEHRKSCPLPEGNKQCSVLVWFEKDGGGKVTGMWPLDMAKAMGRKDQIDGEMDATWVLVWTVDKKGEVQMGKIEEEIPRADTEEGSIAASRASGVIQDAAVESSTVKEDEDEQKKAFYEVLGYENFVEVQKTSDNNEFTASAESVFINGTEDDRRASSERQRGYKTFKEVWSVSDGPDDNTKAVVGFPLKYRSVGGNYEAKGKYNGAFPQYNGR